MTMFGTLRKLIRFDEEIGHAQKKIQQDTAEKRPAKFKLH